VRQFICEREVVSNRVGMKWKDTADLGHAEGIEDAEEEPCSGLKTGDRGKGMEIDTDEECLMCGVCSNAGGAGSLYNMLDEEG